MKKYTPFLTLLTLTLIAAAIYMHCKKDNTDVLTRDQSAAVIKEVTAMTNNIAHDISAKGPSAWLDYFEKSPQFFMASDGQLAFANNDAATTFIQQTLIKTFHSVQLTWNDVRVDALTTQFAAIGAGFHENITDSSGKKINTSGYFTAIAQKINNNWQLRNAHWSINHLNN